MCNWSTKFHLYDCPACMIHFTNQTEAEMHLEQCDLHHEMYFHNGNYKCCFSCKYKFDALQPFKVMKHRVSCKKYLATKRKIKKHLY